MHRYLFSNPDLLETSSGYTIAANPPTRAEPVILREFEWERVLLGLYLTVLDVDGKIKIWYGCRSGKGHDQKHTAYAESSNGTSFKKHGVVIPETMEGSTYVDPNEVQSKRIGYFGNLYGQGLFRWTSSDGMSFTRDQKPLLAFESDTQNVMLWDSAAQRYVAFVRAWDEEGSKNRRRRTVMRVAHDTLEEPWPVAPDSPAKGIRLPHFHRQSDVVLSADPDDPADTDAYTMAPCRYHGFWFAFPTFYRHFAEPDEGPYLNGGRTSVQCVGSSDGITWNRYDRGRYTSPGVDEHMLYMGRGYVERGEEIWQYGIAYNTHHGEVDRRAKEGDGTMYRYVQRKDGFIAAVSTGHSSLVTRPIQCTGDSLYVNIDTDGIGAARIGILDQDGGPIPGYSVHDCDPITINSTRAKMTWNGERRLPARDKQIKVTIESSRSSLFSMWFE